MHIQPHAHINTIFGWPIAIRPRLRNGELFYNRAPRIIISIGRPINCRATEYAGINPFSSDHCTSLCIGVPNAQFLYFTPIPIGRMYPIHLMDLYQVAFTLRRSEDLHMFEALCRFLYNCATISRNFLPGYSICAAGGGPFLLCAVCFRNTSGLSIYLSAPSLDFLDVLQVSGARRPSKITLMPKVKISRTLHLEYLG